MFVVAYTQILKDWVATHLLYDINSALPLDIFLLAERVVRIPSSSTILDVKVQTTCKTYCYEHGHFLVVTQDRGIKLT